MLTFRWLKTSKINKFKILRLSEVMKNEVKHKTMYTYSCASALRPLAYKFNLLIVKGFPFRVKEIVYQ